MKHNILSKNYENKYNDEEVEAMLNDKGNIAKIRRIGFEKINR